MNIMIIKHYFLFNNERKALNTADAWRELRNDPNEPSFFIPATKEKYEAICRQNTHKDWITFIRNFATENHCNHIFSVGSGVAILEYWLKKETNLSITVSDYNDSIFKLSAFNIFDSVLQFDALNEKYPVDKKTIILLNRIDTEFDDEMWSKALKNMSNQSVQYVICIPTELLTLKSIAIEIKTAIKSLIKRKKRTNCGFIRSKRHFIKEFAPFFKIKTQLINHKPVFILKAKQNL